MKSSRLLSILIRLQARGRMTADELAAELEVSPRTIHRDIDQLSYAGVPVYAERGRNGGFMLMDGYQTRLTGLDADEASTLMLSGIGAALKDLGLQEAATKTELKLLASLPREMRDKAALVSDRFLLDPLGWYTQKTEEPFVRQVAVAVWAEQQISIRYQSWKGVVERVLSPLALVLKAGNWYLVAEAETIRTYRISNILSLEPLEGGFARPEDFDLGIFWSTWISDFEQRLRSQTVMLRCSAKGLRLLQERNAAPEVEEEPSGPSGTYRVSVKMETGESALCDILSLGSEAEVIAPPDFREKVIAESRRISGLYSS